MAPKILWLIPDRWACGVYRALVPALSMQDAGVAESDFLQHFELGTDPSPMIGKDIVVFQRCYGPVVEHWIKVAKANGIRTVFETDDDLFAIPKWSPAHDSWRDGWIKKSLRRVMQAVDVITVSTRPLAEAMRLESGVPPAKIHVCPNHLHPTIWGPTATGAARALTPEKVVVGWQGSTTHDRDFTPALCAALRTLLAECPEVRMRFFGSVPLSVKGIVPPERFDYSHGIPFHEFPARMRYLNFDIGLAPLSPNRFAMGKSCLKVLEYGALSIPCIASRTGPYGQTITHGVDGFLADTEVEWLDALRRLVSSATERHRVGTAAYARVWRDFGPDRWTHWARAFGLPHGGYPLTPHSEQPQPTGAGVSAAVLPQEEAHA